MAQARDLLAQGKIVAVKGLGGFHLACDATNDEAVAELRRRKGRIDKPFALMAPSVEAIEQFCEIAPAERALLESREHPIVLLQKKPTPPPVRGGRQPAAAQISAQVAPGQATLGVMLPYTPLHELLFHPSSLTSALHPPGAPPPHSGGQGEAQCGASVPHPLVMTSGNFSEEPIATDNDEALDRLAPLADAFLLHNRAIHIRCDDSVVRVSESRELPIRRSRGYAPYPVKLPFSVPTLLAAGAELKNTFCVTRDGYAFLSHHIGDLENYETLKSFEDGVAHFERLFRIKPESIAYDLHPNYLATRYAQERAERDGLKSIGVQHHHAHIAACLAENRWNGDRPVIGVAFDGTGYGLDGAIWGGEFLIADYRGFERAAHLDYLPLPGGDAAIRHPHRIALSYLHQAGVAWDGDLAPVRAAGVIEQAAIHQQLESGLNTFPTSSLGRLFDAVASICGVRQDVNYEGQAAIELEAAADATEVAAYAFEIAAGAGNEYGVPLAPLIRMVVSDVRAGVPAPLISARFHNGLAQLVLELCESFDANAACRKSR